MKFVLVRSNTFIRIARKIFKKKPEIIQTHIPHVPINF
jgi:hypothetical protein